MPIESGQLLSHYRLLEKIGEGGMGVVWKAEDTILGRTVAIKVLPADLSRDEERRKMFLDEAKLASSVSEAHIVQVHEFGRAGDLDFIVMEYVSGKPLSRTLDGRPLSPERVAEWGAQVARALSRAHRKQLLHRDLKPANILITDDGDAKVVDFGLAILFAQGDADSGAQSELETRTSLQSSGSSSKVAGTLAYMSPEQVRGEDLGPHSDIFTLGVVLYEMTTGRRPFGGGAAGDVVSEILKSRPTPAHDLVPTVPLDLERILEKAMAPRRSDRYQTMEDLEVDLRRLGRDLETGSSPAYEDLMQGVAQPAAKRPWVLPALVAGVSIAMVLLAVWMIQRMAGDRGGNITVDAHTILVLPLEVRGQAEDADYVGRAFAEALAVNLAQSKALRVLPVPDAGEILPGVNRTEMARDLGAGILLTGALTRKPGTVHASLSMVDTVENRILWGAQKDAAEGDLAGLAAMLVREGVAELGMGSSEKVFDDPKNLTGGPEMAGSALLAETIGAMRRRETHTVKTAERLARMFPDEPDAQILLAAALVRDWWALERSRPRVERQIAVVDRLSPGSPYGDLFRASISLDYGRARALLTTVLERRDLTPALRRELLRARAWAARNGGDSIGAVADFEEALELDPADAGILADLGYNLREAGRGEDALVRVKQAVALEPSIWFYHHSMGHVLSGLDRHEEASHAYRRACEINRMQQPCAALAGSLAQAGRDEESLIVAREAGEMEDTVGGAYNLACFHALNGRRDKAVRYLRRSFELGGDSAWIIRDPDLLSLHGDPEFEAIVRHLRDADDSD